MSCRAPIKGTRPFDLTNVPCQIPWKENFLEIIFGFQMINWYFKWISVNNLTIIYKFFLVRNTNHELMIDLYFLHFATYQNHFTRSSHWNSWKDLHIRQSNSKKLALIVRSELILILNSTWTNQITHCR